MGVKNDLAYNFVHLDDADIIVQLKTINKNIPCYAENIQIKYHIILFPLFKLKDIQTRNLVVRNILRKLQNVIIVLVSTCKTSLK